MNTKLWTISELRALIESDPKAFIRLLGDDMTTPASGTIDMVREGFLEGLVAMLREAEFSTDDLRFLFVITMMAIAVKPSGMYEQLSKRSPERVSRPGSVDDWGLDHSSPVIGESSPRPEHVSRAHFSAEAAAVINEASVQGNRRVLALMASSDNLMPSRDILEAELGREALDKISRALLLHDSDDGAA